MKPFIRRESLPNSSLVDAIEHCSFMSSILKIQVEKALLSLVSVFYGLHYTNSFENIVGHNLTKCLKTKNIYIHIYI